jgi:hypothetical protein
MKIYRLPLYLIAACSVLAACDSYDFDQEQYRKEINLQQNNQGVYDRQVVDMQAEDSEDGAIIYLVAGLSGSQPSTQDYPVVLLSSDSLFNAYNKSNFDIEQSRYARLLPKECYEEPNLSGVIKAGESQTKFPFKLKNLSRLSPDSTYMLDYEIDRAHSAACNPNKCHVLLRIHWQNEFASTATSMEYSYNSAQVVTPATTPGGSAMVRRPTHTLKAFPVGKNAVRFMAGDETYDDYTKALDIINQRSIVIEVGEKKPQNPNARDIVIRPYRTDEMEVLMQTPLGEYDNTFLLNEIVGVGGGTATYYKEFRVRYKYRLLKEKQSDGSFAPGPFKEVQAKLRYQYNPRADQL